MTVQCSVSRLSGGKGGSWEGPSEGGEGSQKAAKALSEEMTQKEDEI